MPTGLVMAVVVVVEKRVGGRSVRKRIRCEKDEKNGKRSMYCIAMAFYFGGTLRIGRRIIPLLENAGLVIFFLQIL